MRSTPLFFSPPSFLLLRSDACCFRDVFKNQPPPHPVKVSLNNNKHDRCTAGIVLYVTCSRPGDIRRAFFMLPFILIRGGGRRGCVMPQLVDILLLTVLARGAQSLAASTKHRAGLVASCGTVELIIQKVL